MVRLIVLGKLFGLERRYCLVILVIYEPFTMSRYDSFKVDNLVKEVFSRFPQGELPSCPLVSLVRSDSVAVLQSYVLNISSQRSRSFISRHFFRSLWILAAGTR